MGKGVYLGVSNTAKKIKKIYIGVNGVAKKVKKIYIGDSNGVARVGYTSNLKLSYCDTKYLVSSRSSLGATSIGDYALFAGGYDGSTTSECIDYFNNSLSQGYMSISQQRTNIAGASSKSYALLAGGGVSGTPYTNIDVYSASLTHSTTHLGAGRISTVGVGTPDLVIFAGGQYTAQGARYSVDYTDAFNDSLTSLAISALSKGRTEHTGAYAGQGDYFLFGGGLTSTTNKAIDSVEVYSSSLTKLSSIYLSSSRKNLDASSLRGCAWFGGGRYTNGTTVSTIDMFNGSLVRTTLSLSESRYALKACSVMDEFILFGGGSKSNGYSATMDTYDSSGTMTTFILASPRNIGGATSVKNKALFAGGYSGSYENIVNVYMAS